MSASDDQAQDPVLVATDPVISHEVPVPVDGQILKDVSNLGTNETPESVAVGLVSLNKTDASNGAIRPTTSADEKENAPSHEQPASVEDGVFVDDKEVIIHGSDIALEKTKDVRDASVVEVDNAASDSITTDNVDDTTLNVKDNEIIAVKDIPSTSEVESVPAAEHGTPADSDLIAPVANTTEANTIDDSVNDSAIEIPAPVLEKKQGCAKDDEDDAAPADDVKLVETGNHNEAVQMDKRDTTDNVDDNPAIMNQAPNGETLAIAEIALQDKVNGDVDIASSAAEGDALDIDAVSETKEKNVDHVESAAAASEDVAETQEDEPKATDEDIVEQTQGEDAPAATEEQVPVVEAAPTEADLKEDGAVVATETDESNDGEVTTEEVEQGGVDETSAEPTNNLDAEPLVEEVEVGHEVELTAEDVNNIEEAGSHEEPVRSVVEEEPKVAVRVVEEIPDTGENSVVAADETTEAPEIVEEPTNDTEASISTPVEVESISSVSAPVEGESVPASEEITSPVDADNTVHDAASVPVEEEVVPASAVITEPVIDSEEAVPTAEDVETVTPETTNEEASAKVEVEPVTAAEEVTAAPVDEPVTTDAVAAVGNEEASVQVETEPIATPADELIATVTESEVPREGAAACVEAEPLPAGEVITAPVIESDEVAQTSDETGAAAPETSVETYEEAPITIEVQHEVENITEEANEETTASVLAEPVAETEGVTEKAREAETAGHDDVTQKAPGLVEPDSTPTSDEVAATVVEVTEEPAPVAPIELSEETFATSVNVETEEIPASVDALDETTVVEAEGVPIEAPVEVTVAASFKAEHDVTGDAAPTVVAEDDSESSVPGELTTAISEAAAPQADDEATHEEASASVETKSITASGDNDEASIHAPDDAIAEAQAAHTETPSEIALDTVSSTAVAEDENVAEEVPAPAVETAGVDAPETTQEALGTLETDSKSPPPVVEAENAGTSQGAESVPQTDEGAFVPIAAEIAPIEIAQEIVAEGESAVDEEKERAVAVEESISAPVVEMNAISIETSLDTTPFTPVLDSGIEFKEQDLATSTLSSIAEELERSKSSWRPSSFQVSTVGGVESSGVGDAGPVPESTELAETDEPASVPLLVVEDTPVNEQVPTIGASEDFISVDQPLLEQPPRVWATSYSVHSQGIAENFSSIDEPVSTHEPKEPATVAHALPLEEQGELASIPVEEGFTEVINHNESSEQIIEAVGSHVSSTDQVSEPAPADLTEVSEEVIGGLEVGEEDANGNVDQEANQEVEAKLTIDDALARPWTPSYSAHSQGTPLVATKELEDVALSAERSVENHAENAVTVDSEHDNTVDEQINTTENEVYGQLSTEVSHASPVIALEGHKIEDETLNPQQSTQAETNSNLENEIPPRPWTPSYAIHSQGSPAAVPKEVEEASPLGVEFIEQSTPESTATTSYPVDEQENHPEHLTAEFDKSEIPSSVEQSQNNNIGKVVAAAIAPVIALAALSAGSQGLVSVADEEAPQVDATLTVDTTVVPLLCVPSEVVDGDATDTMADALERPRSPWTPSYSVTKQGAGLSQEEEAEVDHLEPLSPVAAQVATTSDSEPQLNEVQEDDPASNALQTRPSYTVAGTEEIAKNEQFLLFGLRAIVAYLWVLPKWLSMTPSDHSRRGSSSSSSSSSSSKFFPGGWFTPKPNEGRTSLDVAQGEFASSHKVTTSNDVFETLGSEVTDSSAAVNVAAEEDGQKRKWCVVM